MKSIIVLLSLLSGMALQVTGVTRNMTTIPAGRMCAMAMPAPVVINLATSHFNVDGGFIRAQN